MTTRPLALFPGGLGVVPDDGTIFVAGIDAAGLLSQTGLVVIAGSVEAIFPLRWDFALVG